MSTWAIEGWTPSLLVGNWRGFCVFFFKLTQLGDYDSSAMYFFTGNDHISQHFDCNLFLNHPTESESNHKKLRGCFGIIGNETKTNKKSSCQLSSDKENLGIIYKWLDDIMCLGKFTTPGGSSRLPVTTAVPGAVGFSVFFLGTER